VVRLKHDIDLLVLNAGKRTYPRSTPRCRRDRLDLGNRTCWRLIATLVAAG
jgi:hypothetical protein